MAETKMLLIASESGMEVWHMVFLAIATGAAALIAVFFTGLKGLVESWFKLMSKRMKKRTYIQQIEKLAEFLDLFERIKKIPEVQRCVVLHGHDSGGLPTPGKPYTVRAVHGWTTKEGKEDPGQKYDFDLQVDGHYIRMLEDMLKLGFSIQVTEKMPQDAKLKAYFLDEGVRSARMYYLGLIDEEMIFISAGSYDIDVFSDKTIIGLQVMVDRLRSAMGETE